MVHLVHYWVGMCPSKFDFAQTCWNLDTLPTLFSRQVWFHVFSYLSEIVPSFYLDLITCLTFLGAEEMLTWLLFWGCFFVWKESLFLVKELIGISYPTRNRICQHSKRFNGHGPRVLVYQKKRKLSRGGLLGEEKTLTRGVSLDRGENSRRRVIW